MRVILKTQDLIMRHYAEALLKDAQIAYVPLDTEMSGMEGGICAFPARLMVDDDDYFAATQLLRDGIPGYAPP